MAKTIQPTGNSVRNASSWGMREASFRRGGSETRRINAKNTFGKHLWFAIGLLRCGRRGFRTCRRAWPPPSGLSDTFDDRDGLDGPCYLCRFGVSLSVNRWWNNPSYFPASEYYGFEPKVLPVGVLLCGARRKASDGFREVSTTSINASRPGRKLLASAWWARTAFTI